MVMVLDFHLSQRFRRFVSDEIMAYGNHKVDRLVSAYLLERIDPDGSVGSAIAYGRIGLDISEKPVKGKSAEEFSANDVRNAVRRMESAGLVELLGERGKNKPLEVRFVFSAFAAALDYSAQNKLTHSLRTSYDQNNVKDHNVSGVSDGQTYAQLTISSYPSILPTNARDSVQPSVDKFRITLDWQPSEVFRKQIETSWKPSDNQMQAIKAKRMGFCVYWSTQDMALTQQEWELKFWNNELEKLFSAQPAAAGARVADMGRAMQRKAMPKPLSVPQSIWGPVLRDWGLKHGFRDLLPGEEDDDYRRWLRTECERRNLQQEREAMGVKHGN